MPMSITFLPPESRTNCWQVSVSAADAIMCTVSNLTWWPCFAKSKCEDRGVSVSSRCPKCQHERSAGQDACARCGLLVSLWEKFAATAHALDRVLAAPWTELEAAWTEDAAHARFLEAAAAADALDIAAAHYR